MIRAALFCLLQATGASLGDLEPDLRALARPLIDGEVVPSLVVSWITPQAGTGSFGIGQLSREDPRVPDETTAFEIGSVTKTFTALLLARRVALGELALNTELSDLLPEDCRPPASTTPVRLVDVVTHSAGFPAIPTNLERDMSLFVVDYSVFDGDKMRSFLRGFESVTDPGQSFLYSNAGFGVLGWAFTERAESSLEELLRAELFEPLELKDTFIRITAERAKTLAPSHDPNGDPVPPANFATLEACGAIRSTAADMMRYLQVQLEPTGELASAIELTQTVNFRDPRGIAIGLAWQFSRDEKILFHDGQTGGQACFVFFNPSTQTAGLVLANGSTPRVAELGVRLMKRISGEAIEPPTIRVGVDLREEQLVPLEGVYLSLFGSAMQITREENRLYARLPRQAAFRLHPSAATEFFYRDIDAEISFELDESSTPARAVVLHQNGRDTRYVRRKD